MQARRTGRLPGPRAVRRTVWRSTPTCAPAGLHRDRKRVRLVHGRALTSWCDLSSPPSLCTWTRTSPPWTRAADEGPEPCPVRAPPGVVVGLTERLWGLTLRPGESLVGSVAEQSIYGGGAALPGSPNRADPSAACGAQRVACPGGRETGLPVRMFWWIEALVSVRSRPTQPGHRRRHRPYEADRGADDRLFRLGADAVSARSYARATPESWLAHFTTTGTGWLLLPGQSGRDMCRYRQAVALQFLEGGSRFRGPSRREVVPRQFLGAIRAGGRSEQGGGLAEVLRRSSVSLSRSSWRPWVSPGMFDTLSRW